MVKEADDSVRNLPLSSLGAIIDLVDKKLMREIVQYLFKIFEDEKERENLGGSNYYSMLTAVKMLIKKCLTVLRVIRPTKKIKWDLVEVSKKYDV